MGAQLSALGAAAGPVPKIEFVLLAWQTLHTAVAQLCTEDPLHLVYMLQPDPPEFEAIHCWTAWHGMFCSLPASHRAVAALLGIEERCVCHLPGATMLLLSGEELIAWHSMPLACSCATSRDVHNICSAFVHQEVHQLQQIQFVTHNDGSH